MFFCYTFPIMAFPDRLQQGLNFRTAPELIILFAPNLFNWRKLRRNLRHPIGEVLHTSHEQIKVAMIAGKEYDMVLHKLGKKLVTVDIVVLTDYQRGLLAKARQIFGDKFYLGHDRDFPQPFELVDRHFVRSGSGFDRDVYAQSILNQIRENPDLAIQIFPFSALVQSILSFFLGKKIPFSPALAASH